MSNSGATRRVYTSVVEDVISNVREAFLDEGVDEQVLQELKQLWESKLSSSRALDPPEPEAVVAQGNIPYQLMQPQTSQTTVHATNIQQQIPVPVQLNADGHISTAAGMAFQAPGMYPQQVQTLLNVNQNTQLTLQQTANGQFILVAPGQGVSQGVTQGQVVNLQQPTIIQGQPGQIQGQTLPQFDGACDEAELQMPTHAPHCHIADATSSYMPPDAPAHHDPCHTHMSDTACSGACGLPDSSNDTVQVEFETSPRLTRKLQRMMDRQKRKSAMHQRRKAAQQEGKQGYSLPSNVQGERKIPQLDGNHDTSSSDDDNFDDDDENNDDDDDKEEGDDEGEEEEPLNSEDDVSEDDPTELFDTDNVVVCQFEKISRNKGKWKFFLKDGIMNLEGKDHVFQRGTGEADW